MSRALSCVLLGFTTLGSQNIEIRPRFVQGDTLTIAMTRSVEEFPDQRTKWSVSRTIQVDVISTGTQGTVLKWRPGPAELKGAAGFDAHLVLAQFAISDHDFQLSLDANGQFRSVANRAELGPSLERARDAARARVTGIDDPVFAGRPSLTGDIIAGVTVGLDASLFTGFYGLAHSVGQDVETPATFPLPGGKFTGTRRLRIASANADMAELSMSFVVDADTIRKGLPVAPPDPSMKLELSETGRHVFDRRIGLHRAGSMERRATLGPDVRVEKHEFTMTAPPKR